MDWFKFFAHDFIRLTAHLSTAEKAWFAWMRVMYDQSGPFPSGRIAVYRIVGCVSKAESKMTDRLLDEFFKLEGDVWLDDHMEWVRSDQLTRAKSREEAGRKAGKASGRARKAQKQENAASQPRPNESFSQRSTIAERKLNER